MPLPLHGGDNIYWYRRGFPPIQKLKPVPLPQVDLMHGGRCRARRSVFYRCPVPHSKSKVDRAGQTLADHLRLVVNGKRTIERSRAVLEAVEIIDWWREEHARPLLRVAANLHQYADQHEAPKVAQR
jgi:hypothetical protein